MAKRNHTLWLREITKRNHTLWLRKITLWLREISLYDIAPKEIQARGQNAMQAYHTACTSGTQPVYRSRLMLVGKDRVGKTSLKRALTGLSHNKEEKSTNGIDLSSSCSFNLNNRSSWKLALKGDNLNDTDSQQTSESLGSKAWLEEEYNQALANNIVQEILSSKYQTGTTTVKSTKSPVRSPKHRNRNSPTRRKSTQSLHRQSLTKTDFKQVPPDLISNVPDHITQLVQKLLDNHSTGLISSPRHPTTNRLNNTVVLNIWDFAGQAVYYTTHQVFLTSRAVYVIVFNLCDDLTGKEKESQEKVEESEDLSTLEYMDFWMRSIHAHAAENTVDSVDNMKLSPPIFIVGTHRDSLDPDYDTQKLLIEEKFNTIKEFIIGKPYTQHIVTPFFAVENDLNSTEEDDDIDYLRSEIEKIAGREYYMGEQMPIKWLKFEQEITRLADEGTYYATYDQVCEIGNNNGITDESELKTVLEFYHDLGVIVYYGSSSLADNLLRNTVILKPQWLIDMFRRFILNKSSHDQWNLLEDKWKRLENVCIIEEPLIDQLWHDALSQKYMLLGLMEKFDLICVRIPPQGQSHREEYRTYYVPMRLRSSKQTEQCLYSKNIHNVTFYLDFNGFLPDGLFYRILTRATRWSQDNGGRDPYLFKHSARFYVDSEHDFVLEMSPKEHNIKVIVIREVDLSNELTTTTLSMPSVCAKVRNFLESTLCDLRAMWMKRIAYKTCVVCPCEKKCLIHDQLYCPHHTCQHFLDLDECLTNKIVCCDHRRIKTEQYQKWFPSSTHSEFKAPILSVKSLEDVGTNIERNAPDLPKWLKGAAKLLNGGAENQDWMALSRTMGYKSLKIDKFNDDLNPALALLSDWIVTSGNTALSIDMLLLYLHQLQRFDIVEVINSAKDIKESCEVFLSYQWDNQDEVQKLRDYLERSGYSCWMDIGQMGGGDFLNAKIDEGIRNAKVVIACLTPKYIVSHLCNRELSLADVLQKPIIPVLFDPVIWPPPGGLAVILSQLVYIDLKGVGGHGGTGIHGDIDDKYREIIQHVSLYASPTIKTPFKESLVVSDETVIEKHDESQSLSHSSSLSSFSDHDVLHSTFSDVGVSRPQLTVTPNRVRSQRSSVVPTASTAQVTKCAVCVLL
ncbi:hypothetical protein LOTGIDRAFT_152367 [Lottia gigantea]|uniref:non-specific serine/threonine protein kinase n=1 Tax=Lottia gigantea TaxID=225164 RepID=V4BHZ2_LOTGI|nr:hypothetical protein LOTGIDRAFT_152367 [Lottia gigantea]ESP05512.1 hypothetical protein LOTGIDRAFT_152367 [Lottia gigantea]